MTLRLTCRDFAAPDLPRRGLAPQETHPAVLLVGTEAELTCRDGGQFVRAARDGVASAGIDPAFLAEA
ncbi:hypothetical protein AB0C81_20380 [Streptomyces roseoverticillatus]|uniref:hypothetical protein n=1 Tax=Streptomyces roseoverticillatus TaxID=66429 RepID=UPI0033CD21AD